MKIPLRNLILMVFCLHSFLGYSQNGEFDVRLVQIDYSFDPCLQLGKTSVDVEIKANASATNFSLADQNYRMTIDTNVLRNPIIKQEHVLSGIVNGPGYSATFNPHTLTGSLGDIVSYNVAMGGGSGYPLDHINYIKVGQLEFDVLLDQSTSINWISTGFPVTVINEFISIDSLKETVGIQFDSVLVDSLIGAPIPQRISQNGHICIGQLGDPMEYSVANGSFYDFRIIPPSAGSFLPDANNNTNSNVNVAFIEFSDATLDSAKVQAGKTFGCGFYPHREWTVYFDKEGTHPGDIDNDGIVNWSSDATAQLYALATMFEEQQANPTSAGTQRVNDRVNNNAPYQVSNENYDFNCQYADDWKDANGNDLTFNLNGQAINMKHADSNGDGVLVTTTATDGYEIALDDLSTISGGPLDADIIGRYHFEGVSSGAPNAPATTGGGILHIQSLDSVMAENKDLRLKVDLGEANVPVSDVQSIGFRAEFTYGRFVNPGLRLDSTYMGNPTDLLVSDYAILPDTSTQEAPSWYVAIGRPDLTGVEFRGEEVCRIICEVTIAGVMGDDENASAFRAPPPAPDSVTIYLRDVVIITKNGVALTYPGDSITLDYVPISAPVGLSEFTATRTEEQIDLFWRTETEVDFDKFELERSTNNIDFEKIHTQRGKGVDGNGASYFFYDLNIQFNTNMYYRLKMIDHDGTVHYSNVEVVKFIKKNFSNLEIRPNPIQGNTTLIFEALSIDESLNIRLFNSLGQQVYRTQVPVKQGVNNIPLQLENYPDGIYQLHVSQGNYKVTRKLVKVN